MRQKHSTPHAPREATRHAERDEYGSSAKPLVSGTFERLKTWYGSTAGYGFLSAALLWASLPPLGLSALAWIAPLWWLLLVRRPELTGRRPYWWLWAAGFAFWLGAYHWLRLPHWATSFGWIAIAFYLGLYIPAFVGLGRVAVHRLRVPLILAAPTIWTGLELARAHILTGITMGSLSHTQYRWVELIQLSDLGGAYAVSFVIMFVAACIARMLPCGCRPLPAGEGDRSMFSALAGSRKEASRRKMVQSPARQWLQWWPALPAAAVLGGTLAYGFWKSPAAAVGPSLHVALIQGSLDTRLEADPSFHDTVMRHYYQLSRQALDRLGPVDLVVWPESMFRDSLCIYDRDAKPPSDFSGTQAEFLQALDKASKSSEASLATVVQWLGAPLITGIDTWRYTSAEQDVLNSAVQISRDGKLLGRYDKMHLVMFGEYVPLADWVPWLQRLTPLPISMAHGREPVAFDCGPLRMTPSICYEDVLPHLIRRQVNTLAAEGREPDVLLNLTNDGWFYASSELDMHLACGVFRAVECRKPMLVAANAGFSANIDASGRILVLGGRHVAEPLLAEVQADGRSSWYLGHGDWFAGVCLAFCGVVATFGLVQTIRLRRRETQTSALAAVRLTKESRPSSHDFQES